MYVKCSQVFRQECSQKEQLIFLVSAWVLPMHLILLVLLTVPFFTHKGTVQGD